MDAEGCLERTREFLSNKGNHDFFGRAELEEAVMHLEEALNNDEWKGWMPNAISVPCECPDLPEIVRNHWSDSSTETELGSKVLVDLESLRYIREVNEPGSTMDELIKIGIKHHDSKLRIIREEEIKAEERAEKRRMAAEKAGQRENITLSAANTPQKGKAKSKAKAKVKTGSKPRKERQKKLDEVEERLAEAERNAVEAERLAKLELPPPITENTRFKTRSAKLNFVIETLLGSHADDKFVIYGTKDELEFLAAAMDLCDITR
jgi:hypothetical protein